MEYKMSFGRERAKKLRLALQQGRSASDVLLDWLRAELEITEDERWGEMVFASALDQQAELIVQALASVLSQGKAPRQLVWTI